MNAKIVIAHGPMGPPNRESSIQMRSRVLRRELALLWISQTIRNMRIIGLTRSETMDVVRTALHGWCGDAGVTAEASEIHTDG